ncbi:hypothetical protein AK830_g2582 [Neonectria ditissima]|uniref:FAD-binding domain-containing protein n=1 Tax=Neonectria ditissima TaxID=78410 RepID=A0A0N8H890_9HYPO|nr:hypothetical protein AK830_g2582 [Neonectria ditissima]
MTVETQRRQNSCRHTSHLLIPPPHQRPCRAHRSKLQQALLKETNQSRIRVGRKLVSTSQLESGRLRLSFEGGYTDEVDLLIGADGIRSVVREFAFPDHSISHTGSTAYRGLARTSDALKTNGLEKAVIFWHGTGSKWIYTCPLGGDDLEVTVRIKEPYIDGEERVSGGQEASIRPVQDAFSGELSPPLRQLLNIVDRVQQFDFFAGPRLGSIVQHGSIALIGDASHPLSGAFGAGTGFALEDAYVLGGALEWAVEQGKPVSAGLEVFDRVRSPHYEALYGVLDQYGVAEGELASLGLSPQDEIKVRIDKVWNAEHDWMYYYQADTALEQELQKLSLESSELHS